MIALTGCLLFLLLIMLLLPASEAGQLLHLQLVERPLAWLAGCERHHLIYALIIGSILVGGGELMFLAGPELVTMWAMNLSIYFDAVIVTYALSALVAARGLKSWAGQKVIRIVRPNARARRTRRSSGEKPDKASNDDASNDDDARPRRKIAA